MRHFLTIFFIFISVSIFSQQPDTTKINFLNANRFFTTEELGPENKIFVGEVVLVHDSTTFFCDSAIFNSKEKKVDAFGNIEIQRLYNYYDTIFIYGDTLHYNGISRKLTILNNVKFLQDTTELTSNHVDYDIDENFGKYIGGGKITSGSDTIISDVGYYYARTKDVFFKKDVVVKSKKAKLYTDTLKHNLNTRISYILGPSEIYNDSSYIYTEFGRYDYNENRAYLSKHSRVISGEHTIEADSLFFDRANGIGKGFGNVKITDTIQNLILKGNYGEFHNENQYSMMTDSAIFIEIENRDTLWMHSDTLKTFIDTLFDYNDVIPFRVIYGYHHVKIYKKDLQVKTDSLVYSQLDSVISLFGSPVIWSEDNQLYANYIELSLADNEPKEMNMYDSAYISQKADSGQFNVTKGDFVHAIFKKSKVYKVSVVNNITVVYYLKDDKDSSTIGISNLTCDSMTIWMKNNKIDLLVPYSGPKGNIYPPDKVPKGKDKIPGFMWFEDYRPYKPEDIFIWLKKEPVKKEDTVEEIEETEEDIND